MYKAKSFKKKLLVTAIASTAFGGFSGVALAQGDVVEEVVVTGVRASLERAMDVKRESPGVVDAINSEDIGKFPDTNLAESLQRITGVSIDRVNGEGSSVTVRGFSGEFNLVTLNGRQMPAASAYGGGSGAGGTQGFGTRSFDFANLASESVGGVQVYKTGRAAIATGGIGATINIDTAKPFDKPGLQGSVGLKAVHDTTTRIGDEVTPEVSGIFSWTDDNEMFGVGLSASYQERDSAAPNATVNDWNIRTWGEDDNQYSMAPGGVITNAPDEGQLYARPNDIRYAFSDRHRERTNAQLTLQFRPIETLTLTGDVTYAENYLQEHRGEQTFWFANGNSATNVEFDDAAVATPVVYAETLSGKDHGFEQQWREQENTLESFGFNADWEVTDSFNLRLDVHDSTMESLPVGPGKGGEVAISVAAPIQSSQTVIFNDKIPVANSTIDDSNTNNNGMWDVGDFGTQIGRIAYAAQTTDMTQAKVDATFEFDDGRFDFGVETRAMEMNQQNSTRQMTFGNWGVSDAGSIPEGMLEEFSLTSEFDDLSGAQQFGVRAPNPTALMAWAIDTYATDANGYEFSYDPNFNTNNIVEEDTEAAYFQIGLEGELGGMATNILAGVRYETTDVDSTSLVIIPDWLVWEDNNDFRVIRTAGPTPLSMSASYDNLLPSFDFDIAIREDLKTRFSYSKTIARAAYGNLAVAPGNFGTVGSTLLGTTPTATGSNPGLLPLESDNLDISVEWYYNDSSYASVGFFEKRVSNFLGSQQIMQTHLGIRDQTNGPRAEAALAALQSRSIGVDDTSLFVMMAVLDNPLAYPDGADDVVLSGSLVDADFAREVATLYDLTPNADDPLMEFSTAVPVNNKEAKLYGAEFAVQHFFGDTGFGVQANYTVVRGDVAFNNTGDPLVDQFALTGLSDTANLVGIYENYGFTARLAYNWRDSFLSQINRGNSRNPTYVDSYSQLDMSLSYAVNDQLSVTFEGINLTEEDSRQYGRTENQLWYAEEQGARFQLGARYTF